MKPITMYSAVGTHSTAQQSTAPNRTEYNTQLRRIPCERYCITQTDRLKKLSEKKTHTKQNNNEKKKIYIKNMHYILWMSASALDSSVYIDFFFHYFCTECISIPSLVVYIKSCARIQMQTHRTHLPKTSIT